MTGSVLFFGTYDVRTHPRVQVLREGVRSAGIDVRECNAPLGLGTSDRVRVLSSPWLLPGFVLRLLARWARLVRCVRRRRDVEAVLVGYMGHFDVLLARRLFPALPIVLDHLISASDTARDRGLSTGWKDRLLRWLDDRAIGAADLVIVDTEEHAELVPPHARDRVVVVPVGAPTAWFEARQATRHREPADPLQVVFFGLYTPLQGAPVIGQALGRLADRTDLHVTMIGHGQDLEEARRLAGPAAPVTWQDWADPDQLPGLVASADVCLGIFGTGPKAQRVVPNKLFQGAAAGCALVTSDTPPQRRVLGDAALFVPPGDADALAEALTSLAADRDGADRLRAAAAELADSRFGPQAVGATLVPRLPLGRDGPRG